jgi:hypothetical protein
VVTALREAAGSGRFGQDLQAARAMEVIWQRCSMQADRHVEVP